MPSIPNTTRTDEDIKIDVIEELRWDTRVDASKVQVTVYNGVVTLTGTVPTLGTRSAAATDAWSVLGVTHVNDELSVELYETPPIPPDEEIRAAAEQILAWNPDLDATNVAVNVKAGVVELSGTVATHWEKMRAEQIVGELRGILSVTNQLAVVPTRARSDENIAVDVVAALERSMVVDPARVDVTVSDGVVTLKGNVHSDAARRAAYRAASHTSGVVNVSNQLLVTW